MYTKILVALENSPTDDALIEHIGDLAARLGSELVLVHVADGWAARNYEHLQLAESEEMKADREYLERTAARMRPHAERVTTRLALGNPPTEILSVAAREHCDLIAMTSHGHRLVGDIVFGSTIHEVRHKAEVPVLLVKAHRT